MLAIPDLAVLACPACHQGLTFEGRAPSNRMEDGQLSCRACPTTYPVRDGLAQLYQEQSVQRSDRLLRSIYNRIAPIHDMAVKYTLPLFQGSDGTEEQLRYAYFRRLALENLAPAPGDTPLRILEVGIGTGANVPRIRRALRPELKVEVWGVDLSTSMLELLRRQARRLEDGALRLALADAHALPFRGGMFDRVFHVGGINGYGDPGRALREMARVAKPGTPVAVVDEQLDSSRPHTLYHQLMFRMVTFYDRDPHCPVNHVPQGMTDVRQEQISRFFYCLSFRTPAAPPPAS